MNRGLIKVTPVLIALVALGLVISGLAIAATLPDTFSGTLKINSVNAPAGTKIKALINGVDRTLNGPYVTTSSGSYSNLAVAGTDGDVGHTITFWADVGYGYVQAQQTATFLGGRVNNLGLTTSSAFILNKEVEDGIRTEGGSSNVCGRGDVGWCDNCNSAIFTCSGPGACWTDAYDDPGGCYVWQPAGNPKVEIDTEVNLPINFAGRLVLWTMDYGGGTYENEKVKVRINNQIIGTTPDYACNRGSDCFSDTECQSCQDFGPFETIFNGISFSSGLNIVSLDAADNGGSVSVDRYRIVAEEFCGDGKVDEGEGCDDFNTKSSDGCSADCKLEFATLRVIKNVVNDNGGTASPPSFTISISGNSPSPSSFSGSSSGTEVRLNAGSYSVSETGPSGYSSSFSGCSGEISYGQEKTCTITNDDIAPKLTVVKEIVNDNGGTKQVSGFPLFVDSTQVTSGVQNTFNAGTHIVSETQDPGYSASIRGACDGDGSVTLDLGDVKTCVVRNDDTPAKIIVVKEVVNNNGGTKTASQFALLLDGNVVSNGAENIVQPGNHVVSEIQDSGYETSVRGACDGDGTVSISLGEIKTCTVRNDDIPAKLTVTKIVVNNNGGTKQVSDFPLFVSGNSVASGAQNTFNAGTYTVSETNQPGYSATIGGDCASNGRVTLNNGDVKSCTITNDDKPARITVTKQVINNNGGTKTVSDFPLFIDGVQVTSGVPKFVSAGTHTVSETNQPAYSATIGGDCSSNGQITVSLGQNKSCTITNDDVPARLIVIKNVINDNGGTKTASDFTITVTGNSPNPSSFPGSSGTNVTLNAGSYSVSESSLNGYSASFSADCSGTINVGQVKTCTVTNNDIPAKIIVVKEVVNNNGGTKTASQFTLLLDGNVVTNGTANNVLPGTHTVSEVQDRGYSSSTSGACDGNGQVTISLGETKTCTITNDDIPARLTVTKIVVNDNGGTKQVSDFPLFVNGTQVTSGVQNTFNAGTYTVSETSQTGYSATVSGDCSSNGQITLNIGDAKSCTITNDDIPARLIVIKNVINDNGGTALPSNFTINVSGNNPNPASFLGSAGTNVTLNAGSYSVNETGPAGYASTLSANCSGTMANGETRICTITNSDIPPRLVVIKNVINDNGGAVLPANFTINVSGNNPNPSTFPGSSSGTSVTLNAGSYSVSEAGPSGYSAGFSGCSGTISVGQTKTCTITNDDVSARITVIKIVVNNNGGNKTVSDFQLLLDNNSVTSGVAKNVMPGTHLVGETQDPGYTASVGGNCAANGQVTISLGQNKTCTITNDDIPARLTVTKVVINNNGGNKTVSDFTLFVNNTTVASGVQNTFNKGNYVVSEISQPGYTASVGGDCSSNGQISLDVGDIKSCTITNDDVLGKLIIIKHVVNNNGGNRLSGDFNINVTGNNADPSNFSGSEIGVNVTIDAGSYSIIEKVISGYEPNFSAECGSSGFGGGSGQDVFVGVNGVIGNGETKTCVITNDDLPARLIVVKNVINDNGGAALPSNFTINITGNNPNPFSFPGSSGTNVSLDAGNYSVAESGPGGYSSLFTNCSGSINVGQVKICEITNDDIKPRVIVIKNVINDNGGKATSSNFTINVTGNNSNPFSFPGSSTGTNVTLNADSYLVSETGPSGYAASFSTDCSGTINVGQVKTCTITNDDVAAKLTVTKVVANDNGGTKTVSDFSLFVNGTPVVSGEQNNFNAGTYIVSETTQPGYSATISGDCSSNGQVILNVGDVKSCTISNNDLPAKLIVIKNVINDNGGTFSASSFNITVNGTNASPDRFPGSSGGTNVSLDAGQYSVSETGPSGYAASFSGCDGTLSNGQTKTCTITNDDIPAKLIVIKNVVNNNGGGAVPSDFTINVTGNNPNPSLFSGSSGTNVTINAGSYAVTESGPNGYSSNFSPNCSGSIAIGQTKTCTIINDDIPTRITVTKIVINDNGGNKTVSDFALFVDNISATSGSTVNVTPGTHVVSEIQDLGYSATIGGDCNPSGQVNVSLGQNKACTITNDDLRARLIVIKHVVNNNGGNKAAGDFNISVNGTNASPANFAGNESGVNVALDAGTYSISEQVINGYEPNFSAECSGSINNGETKTCIISNNDIPPKLIVIKNVVNDNGGTALPSDFTINVTGNNPGPATFAGSPNGTAVVLNAGTYSVSETGPPGYSGSFSTDCNGALDIGQIKSCTITNDDISAKIRVTKIVVNDNGGTKTVSDFPLFVDNTSVTSGIFVNVTPDTHIVSETNQFSYTATIGGDCAADGTVTVLLGQNKSCTITNDDLPAKLIVTKLVINNNGGTATPSDFVINVSGNSPDPSSFSGSSGTNVTINAGNYSVAESGPGGYSASFSGCNGTINIGETKTCTISNDDVQPRLIVFKHVINDENGTALPSNFTINVTGNNPNPASFPGNESGTTVALDAGPYFVNESGPEGYAAVFLSGCNGNISVGQTTVCNITNDDIARCGDGSIQTGEQCDDGNNINNDGCSAQCLPEIPDINITKTAGNATDGGTYFTPVNSTVVFTFNMTNTGNVTLFNVTVNDDKLGFVGVIPVLLPGEKVTLAKNFTVTQDHVNTVTVIGHSSAGTVNDTDNSTVVIEFCGDNVLQLGLGEQCDDGANNNINNSCTDVCTLTFCGDGTVQQPNGLGVEEGCDDGNVIDGDGCSQQCQREIPDIRVIKTAGGAGDGETLFALVNSTIEFKYFVVNNGQVTLFNVTVTDDKLGFVGVIPLLAPDANATLLKNATVGQDQTNIGTAAGHSNVGDVNDTDNATIDVVNPGINIEKRAGTAPDDTPYLTPPGPVTFLYVIRNTGDTHLIVLNVTDDNGTLGTSDDFVFNGSNKPVLSNLVLSSGGSANFTHVTDVLSDRTNVARDYGRPSFANGTPMPGIPVVTATDDATVVVEVCGNNRTDTGEQCDDGNTQSDDGCDAQCRTEFCGDGITNNVTEQCDDANLNNTDACTNNCTLTYCGDALVQYPNGQGRGGQLDDGFEGCDDGNSNQSDTCTSSCTLTFCGDQIVQTPNGLNQTEECDDGNAQDGDGCDHKCRVEECGNERIDFGEQCDDGNIVNGDGCSSGCLLESAKLIVIKNVVNDNGGTALSNNFTINVNGTNVSLSSFPGSESGTNITLSPGGYSVSETEPSGYVASFSANCSGTIGFGQTKTCTITNDDVPAKMTVVKLVVNNNGGNRTASEFQLFIDNLSVTNGVPNNVAPGTHVIREINLPGYSAVISGDCTPGGQVNVSLGENKTCTIINDDIPARLIVTKIVINNDGGNKTVSDFPLFVNGNSVTSGASNTVNPGSHVVSELNQPGYGATISGDCSANGSVTAALGENKTCTITNDDVPARITVVKNVVNDNGGNKTASQFSLFIDNVSVTNGIPKNVTPGTHTVSEIQDSGYSSAISGDCAANGQVNISLGQNKTCTITNNDIQPKLIVIKNVINDNGGKATSGNFTIRVNGTNASPDNFPGSSAGTNVTLNAGSYAINETGPSGYSATFSANCSGSMNVGQVKICTVTNDDIPSLITVIKVVINDDGRNKTASDFTLLIDNASVTSGVSVNVTPGTHLVSELQDPNYTATIGGNCSSNGLVSISSGQNKTCTITNDDVARCGDSITQTGEECDDGNLNSTDLCSNDCTLTFCGDALAEYPNGRGRGGPLDNGFEGCDDGNGNESDTCTSSCTLTFCGDWIIQAPNGLDQQEECDDGNAIDGDGCDHKCRVEECGNGRLDFDEQCDDNNTQSSDGCNSQCVTEFCGDNVLQLGLGEQCDDGNNINNDGCSAQCLPEIPDINITKTAGNATDGGTYFTPVNSTVVFTFNMTNTGNVTLFNVTVNDDKLGFVGVIPVLLPGEKVTLTKNFTVTQNHVNTVIVVGHSSAGTVNDTDNSTVVIEFCGDNITQPGLGEQCDDGANNNINNSCTDVCTLTFCGDGFVQQPNGLGVEEGCDDGNVIDGDGCSQQCQTEIPDINITKTAGGAGDNQNLSVAANSAVEFEYNVTNNGQVKLFNITVDDDKLGFIGVISSLDPGKSVLLLKNATLAQDQRNVVTVIGRSNVGDVNDTDDAFVDVIEKANLIVIKNVVNNNGGTTVPSNFTMFVNGTNVSLSSFPGMATGMNITLNIGNYSVNETGPSGYSSTFSANCSGVIGAGQTKTCTITNDDIPGKLIVTKRVINNNGGTASPNNFTIIVNGTNALPNNFSGSSSGTAVVMDAGQYSVSETGPGGYAASFSSGCIGIINIGEIKTCNVTNDDISARITVIKLVVNNNGGNKTVSDFLLFVDNVSVTNGSAINVTPGVHVVSEVNQFGYTAAFGGDCNPSGQVSVALGQNKTCTIANDDQFAKLIVVKNVLNDNGGTALPANFTISVIGNNASPSSFSGSSAGRNVTLNAGSYSVSEAGPSGYDASFSSGCIGTISVGETKTCTITNDDISAKITVTKIVVNDDGLNKSASEFQLFVDNVAVASGVPVNVVPGTHVASEAPDPDYQAIISGDCATNGTVTLSLGQNKSCIIVNNDKIVCGNGVVQTGEECDDGNNINNDGCSSQCKIELCGDGVIQNGEGCDDGNNVDGDGCSAQCLEEVCTPIEEITEFSDDNKTRLIEYTVGGGSNASSRVNVPLKLKVNNSVVNVTGIPVSFTGERKLDISVVNDVSGSMDDNCGPDGRAQPGETPCKINDLKNSTKKFLDIVIDNTSNKVGLVSYSTTVVASINLTNNSTRLNEFVNNYSAAGRTCISCGIRRGIDIIRNGTNPGRVMILMSDGIANTCFAGVCAEFVAKQEAINEASRAFNQFGITVHTIAFGEDADAETLMNISRVANGTFNNASVNNLTEAFMGIAFNITMTFPENTSLDVGSNNVLEWSVSGPYSSDTRVNFTGELASLIETCSCAGCSIEGNTCVIDLNLTSKTAGVLLLHNLSIDGCVVETISASCVDNDSDGYGFNCNLGLDCNDNNVSVHLGATELCDNVDNDCDSVADEGFDVGASCSAGVGACQRSGSKVCSQDKTTTVCNAVPGQPVVETCNAVDDDCDGISDEGNVCVVCIDNDGDSYGNDCPAGLDCNDNNSTINPGAAERCNSLDDDCDSSTDENFGVGTSCSVGVGACMRTGVTVCSASGLSSECDATPGSPTAEICNAADDDCDGLTDEGGVCTTDADGDGVEDDEDLCPGTLAQAVDSDGCACSQKVCNDNNASTTDSCNNQTAQCVFTPLTKLTVIKTVINNNSGNKTVSDFQLFIDNISVTSGAENIITPGLHVVSETPDSGYTAIIGSDCSSDGKVNVSLGENKTCTIINDDIAIPTCTGPFSIDVATDSPVYMQGHVVTIFGNITGSNCAPARVEVAIQVKDTLEVVFADQVTTDNNRNFVSAFQLSNDATPGEYLVLAAFNNITTTTRFNVTSVEMKHVVINEFVSDPPSGNNNDEWIELYNPAASAVDLAGWKLTEAGGSVTTLSGVINAGGFFVVNNPSGILNNDGDRITLQNNNVTIDMVAYGNFDDSNVLDNAPAASDPKSTGRKTDGLDTDNDANDFKVFDCPTKNASNVDTVCGIPAAPTNLAILLDNSGNVALRWTASASPNTLGYRVYFADTLDGFNFAAPNATVTGTNYTDSTHSGRQQRYYIIRAFSAEGEETNENKVGKFTYNLVRKESGTGKNWISIPFNTSLKTAKGIITSIGPNASVVTRYNAITQMPQSFMNIGDGIGLNFSIVQNEGYEITVSANTTWTIVGKPYTSNPPVNLVFRDNSTGKNWLGLPLLTILTNANSLLLNISNAINVRRLDPATQGFEDWNGTGTDFATKTGEGYEVTVSANVTWTPV